jgi:hypothetical protein
MSRPMQMAETFLDQLLAGDVAALRESLHPRVHLRDLQPGSTIARVGAWPVAADLAQLFGRAEVHVLDRGSWQFAGRLGLGYRLLLGSPPDRRECEQRMYLDVEDGLIRSIDVLSSGWHPCVPIGGSARLMSPLDEGAPR